MTILKHFVLNVVNSKNWKFYHRTHYHCTADTGVQFSWNNDEESLIFLFWRTTTTSSLFCFSMWSLFNSKPMRVYRSTLVPQDYTVESLSQLRIRKDLSKFYQARFLTSSPHFCPLIFQSSSLPIVIIMVFTLLGTFIVYSPPFVVHEVSYFRPVRCSLVMMWPDVTWQLEGWWFRSAP